MINVKQYWERFNRDAEKRLPENAFDFVSIHKHNKEYTLISPLCLIDPKTSMRPEWERDRFNNVFTAERAAKIICAFALKENGKSLKIVYCGE